MLDSYQFFKSGLRIKLFGLCAVAFLFGFATITAAESAECNSLLRAVAWKQTAAEYRALYHQAYNIARDRLEARLARKVDRPLAFKTNTSV